MNGPDVVTALQASRWPEVVEILDAHQDHLGSVALAQAAVLAESDWEAEPGCPGPADIWILVLLAIRGGTAATEAFVTFVSALGAIDADQDPDAAPTLDEAGRAEAHQAALASGLAVTRVLDLPLLVDDLLCLCGWVESSGQANPALLAVAGAVLAVIHTHSEDVADIDRGVALLRRSLDPAEPGPPLDGGGRFGAQLALAAGLGVRDAAHRFLGSGGTDSDDLHEGIAILRALAEGDHNPVVARRALLAMLVDLATSTGRREPLDEALEVDASLRQDPPDAEDRVRRSQLHDRAFDMSSDPADLDSAIAEIDGAPTLTEDVRDRRLVLIATQRLLRKRHEVYGDVADLRRAVDAAEAARGLLEPDEPRWVHETNSIANALSTLADLTSDVDLARLALSRADEALSACPDDDPALRALLARNLGGRLADLYVLTGDDALLDRAVYLLQVDVAEGDEGDVDLRRAQIRLGAHLLRRNQATGSRSDLDQAIALLESADDDDPDSTNRNDLALALKRRWEADGDPADLDRAIDLLRRVVEAGEAEGGATGLTIGNLGMFLHQRFRASGDATDLDGAVRYTQQAVDAYPIGHRHRVGYQVNFAARHLTRFQYAGDDESGRTAISLMREVLDETPMTAVLRPMRETNLAIVLMTVAHHLRRDGKAPDAKPLVDEAVALLSGVQNRIPEGAQGYTNVVTASGHVLLERHLVRVALGQPSDPGDLPHAIELLEMARDLLPAGPDHGDVDAYLAEAVLAAASPGGLTGPSLDRARDLITDSLTHTPPTSPERPERDELAARLAHDPAS